MPSQPLFTPHSVELQSTLYSKAPPPSSSPPIFYIYIISVGDKIYDM